MLKYTLIFLLIVSGLLVDSCKHQSTGEIPNQRDDGTFHPAEGVSVSPYATVDGQSIPLDSDAIEFQHSDTAITVTLTAPQDGTYRYGFALDAETITPMAFRTTKAGSALIHISAGSIPADILRYPYDWTYRGSRNVLQQHRLWMPAIKAGGKLFLNNVTELTAFHFETTDDGKVRTLLLDYRFYNDGSDAASPDWNLKKGETKSFSIHVFNNLEAAYNFRINPPSNSPNVNRSLITNLYYGGWGSHRLAANKYTQAATQFKGVYDRVIIREGGYDDYGWIPSLFHSKGIKVIDYEFIDGVRRKSQQQQSAAQWLRSHGYDVPSFQGFLLGMPDSGDQLLTNKRGGHIIVNIRKPGIRQFLVSQAKTAIKMGFDGLFYDGGPFWIDSGGRLGTGNVPDAKMSLFHARWLLLKEVRAAIQQNNPQFKLGVLANQYIDVYAMADYLMKERMYTGWHNSHSPGSRSTWVSQDNDIYYENKQAPFIPTNIVYGFKGVDPVSVQSALHFLRDPRGGFYLTSGQLSINRFDDLVDNQTAIGKQNQLYITQMQPGSARVYFGIKKKDGVSVLTVERGNVTVTFSIPVWVSHSGTINNTKKRKLTMKKNEKYKIYNPIIINDPH